MRSIKVRPLLVKDMLDDLEPGGDHVVKEKLRKFWDEPAHRYGWDLGSFSRDFMPNTGHNVDVQIGFPPTMVASMATITTSHMRFT